MIKPMHNAIMYDGNPLINIMMSPVEPISIAVPRSGCIRISRHGIAKIEKDMTWLVNVLVLKSSQDANASGSVNLTISDGWNFISPMSSHR